jgi:hypothetical protein
MSEHPSRGVRGWRESPTIAVAASRRRGVAAPLGGGHSRDETGDAAARARHGQPFALAAAFISRLYSRTFVSDSGLVMSATERNEPSSP